MKQRFERFSSWFFDHRAVFVWVFAALTGLMAVSASRLRVDASFTKSLPLDHEFIRTFTQYQSEFGSANRALIALVPKQGDIFTPEFFAELRRVTDEAMFLPSVDRAQVQSLFTPNVRFIEVVEDGFAGGNVIPADFTPTPENFTRVRENIIKSGKLGQLVANDFDGAIVSAQLYETDPRTGARTDYARVAEALEAIRTGVTERTGGAIDVHVIGFAKVIGDVSEGARGVLLFFGVSLVITSLLVWNYAGRWKLAAAPVVCSLVAVVWQLGALNALGFGIDPFSILVPFLVFAIGVSHGVQMVGAFRAAVFSGAGDSRAAAEAGFRQLLLPGGVALITDTFGFLTMLVIKIEAIRELAITASIGVGVILITNLLLLPIVLSYLRLPPSYGVWVKQRRARLDAVWEKLGREMKPGPSLALIVCGILLGAGGWWVSRSVQIGDTHAGVPELRPDSRYNRDTQVITSKFSIGVDLLSVIAETVPNGVVDHEVMSLLELLERDLRAVPGVQSVVSVASAAKLINAGYSEGSLKWRVLPRNPQALAQAVSPIETATGLLNSDGSVLPVIAFLTDHRAETLRAVTDAVKTFAAQHPSEKVRFRLASGNAGVLAATNEVVAAAQTPIVVWVFGTVIALCLLTFRSVRATLCIVLPLVIVSWLAYALMVFLGIGLKTSTLPVVALGVGIGVDYGIYIFARLQKALRAGEYFEDAMVAAFKDTGGAVIFTGLTLAIGVSTWIFSDLKFQADMGILLTFMFLVNMLGAIVLLPAMARWFWRHHSGHTQAPFPTTRPKR